MRWHWHCWQPGFGAEMSSWSGKRPCVSAWSALALAERSVIQALSAIVCNGNLAGFLSGRIYQGEWKSACLPGLNCYSCPGAIGACPIGSLQSFFSGTVLRFPFYVLGWLLLLGLVFGRWICGWLCPFGWLQDILYRVPLPKYGKTRLTYRLSRLKRIWAVLFVVMLPLGLWLVSGIGEPVFCEYLCPAGTLEAAVPLLLVNDSLRQAAGWLTVWKFAVLAVFLLAMLVIYRPFCRFLCPLGAWYGLFNQQSLLGVRVDAWRCTGCGHCAQICRMDVHLAGDSECISCGDCVSACPEKAIAFHGLKKNKADLVEAKK